MPRNFIILFLEKEGSTPLVQQLDHFTEVDIVHLGGNQGWEPFDYHSSGDMPVADYRRCLDLVWGGKVHGADGDAFSALNQVYTATSRGPLKPFDSESAVGFKMRLPPKRPASGAVRRRVYQERFGHASFELFQQHEVVVFVTVRQDLLRWALSRYHGDGTGRPGHLQFKLAAQKISRDDIPPIEVDLDDFRGVLANCERKLLGKRKLIERLHNSGVAAYPLLYEQFCNDKRPYFRELLQRLEVDVPDAELERALGRELQIGKVHSEDIHDFVVNAEDVLREFGDMYRPW